MNDFTQEWSREGPLGWLETLQRHPHTVFYVARAPDGWIREADLAPLFAATSSTAPAAAVCYFASAHAVDASFQSTVGHEAARLLDAFRGGRGYPGPCSDLATVDAAELRRWWAKRKK